MAPIRPFKIEIPDASLERLHQKLELANFPDEPEAGSGYGANVSVSPTQQQHFLMMIVDPYFHPWLTNVSTTDQRSRDSPPTGRMATTGRNTRQG